MSPREERLSQGSPRPFVTGAPDWFNRARTRSNQRHVLRARPVPIPPPPTGRSFPGSAKPLNTSPRLRKKALSVALSLIVLSAAFSAGFWSRGERTPLRTEVAAAAAAPQANIPVSAQKDDRPQAIEILHLAANTDAASGAHGIPARADNQLLPLAAPVTTESPTPTDQLAAVAVPALPASPQVSAPIKAETQAEGSFALEPPTAANRIADVHLPDNPWFDAGRAESDCTSGLCAAAPPLRTRDRKLNTALVWNSSPEAAAAEARHDRKLVFLLHVSGNFAEPGFT